MIDVNIGKLIYPKLREVCSTYPLVAENTAKFPFCIYRTTATRPQNTKDGIYDWVYNVQVNIVSDKYDDVCDLCNRMLDKILELDDVLDINISEVSEDFAEDAYIKEINIIIKL